MSQPPKNKARHPGGRSPSLAPLPIDQVLGEVVSALEGPGVAVLRAPTGAGKTTRVAPALLEAIDEGVILLLEPRRMAARATAARIAAERGVKLGEEVGYEVRFDRRVTAKTRLIVMTEGIALRKLQADPFLEGVAAILFDEFHERSLNADLAIAMAAKVRREARPDLRICAMSATLDPGPVAAFLGDAPVIESKGRSFPVEIQWRDAPERGPLEPAISSAVGEALDQTGGDVLVFLAGVGEIRRAARSLEAPLRAAGIGLVELFGDLSPDKQDKALRKGSRRRVILSTNVAETSVTIDGVTAVVDTGLAKVLRYDASLGMDRLVRGRIARSSADQRAGRAGRTAPGLCLRLWSRHEDLSLRDREEPELRRSDLARAILELRCWGERDAKAFPWLEEPDPKALERGEQTLRLLGAINEQGLTDIGTRLAAIPAPVRIARMLVEADKFGQAEAGAATAALLSERASANDKDSYQQRSSSAWESDVIAGLDAIAHRGGSRSFNQAKEQLLRVIQQPHSSPAETKGKPVVARDEAILRALLAGWPDRVAKRREPNGSKALLCGGRGVVVAETSEVQSAELFVCLGLDAGRRGTHAEALVRRASAVEPAWLAPELRSETESVSFDPKTGRIAAFRETRYDDLVLSQKPMRPTAAAAEEALAAAAADDMARALDLEDPELLDLKGRLAFLAELMPELELPQVDEGTIRQALPQLCEGRRSFEELRKAPLAETVANTLGWNNVQTLDREAPKFAKIPNGRRVRLSYRDGAAPVLAARIQEMFGLADAPKVAGGRAKVVVHLLAPNRRPAQITDDLASFWRSGYLEVRKELRRRYPKHAWPEDPTTATPVAPWKGKPRRR